tara:strand:- start:274 stop:543 length:270 start_codon:yes stop_codon:yes gene_type:complete
MTNTPNITKGQIQDLRDLFENVISKIESGEYQVSMIDTYLVDGQNNNINILTSPSAMFNRTPQHYKHTSDGELINKLEQIAILTGENEL